jgi:hypothetical protein
MEMQQMTEQILERLLAAQENKSINVIRNPQLLVTKLIHVTICKQCKELMDFNRKDNGRLPNLRLLNIHRDKAS